MKIKIRHLTFTAIILFSACKREKRPVATAETSPVTIPRLSNCTDLKEGIFRMAFYANPYDTAVVTRKNGSQREYYMGSKVDVSTRISWTDSCAYEIELLEANAPGWNKDRGKKAAVKIVTLKNDTAYFVSKFDDPALPEYSGWMVKTGE